MTRPDDLKALRCGGCMHFEEPGKEASSGSCWLNPPIPFSVPVQNPPAGIAVPRNTAGAQTGIVTFPTRPPVTAETRACGQWESEDAPIFEQGPRDAPDVDID